MGETLENGQIEVKNEHWEMKTYFSKISTFLDK